MKIQFSESGVNKFPFWRRVRLTTLALISVSTLSCFASAPGQLPGFEGATGWVNGDPVSSSQLQNKVVVVDFYTSQCSNCLAAVPHVAELYKKYREQGLVVVGVHTPEMESEHALPLVSATIKRLGIEYPVALDNDTDIWKKYHNQFWPNLLIYDKSGKLAYSHAGEGEYGEIDAKVKSLLAAPR
jgi:thiol-disulfide isomerase/thioredoxin